MDLVELRKTTAALLFNPHLDLANPTTLELDTLCNDFRLEAVYM